eukprot:scaffold166555_cov23-Tisochrysis_lutea.AAC.1
MIRQTDRPAAAHRCDAQRARDGGGLLRAGRPVFGGAGADLAAAPALPAARRQPRVDARVAVGDGSMRSAGSLGSGKAASSTRRRMGSRAWTWTVDMSKRTPRGCLVSTTPVSTCGSRAPTTTDSERCTAIAPIIWRSSTPSREILGCIAIVTVRSETVATTSRRSGKRSS